MRLPFYMNYAKQYRRPPAMPGPGKYFDALYGFIPTEPYLRDALDLPIVQRLRHIKQLSTLHLRFPAAHHTRFEHAVGASHLAGLLHDSLAQRFQQHGLSRATRIAVQLAALLHDIGHGPFGHLFQFFATRRRDPSAMAWSHEKVTADLVRAEETGIPGYLGKLRDRHKTDTASYVLSPECIAGLATGAKSVQVNNQHRFLSDFVSTPFGVDRLDYLRRDLGALGNGGGSIDVYEILASLKIVETQDGCRLRLPTDRALALEQLVSVRSYTYRQLYYEPVHRMMQELIIRGLYELNEPVESLQLMTDEELLSVMRQRSSESEELREIVIRVNYRIPLESVQVFTLSEMPNPDSIKRVPFDTWVDVERQVASAYGVSRFIVDCEPIPAVLEGDMAAPAFEDGTSLREQVPPFKLIYGNVHMSAKSGVELFSSTISGVYFGFPYELVEKARAASPREDYLKGMVAQFLQRIGGMCVDDPAYVELLDKGVTRLAFHVERGAVSL